MRGREKGKSRYIEFSQDYLTNLLNDNNSCVTLKKGNQHLALHPYHFNNLNNSLNDILNKKVGKYIKEFDGILLSFKNIKVLESYAPIYDDSCFVHVNIEADFYIFKPELNKTLNGIVVKRFKDIYLGCLLYQIFNVALPKDEGNDNWIGSKVQIGDEISFKITYLNLEGHLPHIKAQPIAPINTNSCTFNKLENQVTKFDDDNEENENVQDGPKIEDNDYNIDNILNIKEELKDMSTTDHETTVDNSVPSKKKRRKRKHSETDISKEMSFNVSASADVPDIPKKKRKRCNTESAVMQQDDNIVKKEEVSLKDSSKNSGNNDIKKKKSKRKSSTEFVSVKEELPANMESFKKDIKNVSKKKHNRNSTSLEDMQSMLLLETLKDFVDNNNIKSEVSSETRNMEEKLEKTPKKKKRNSNTQSVEDMKSLLLQETLNSLTLNKTIKQELLSDVESPTKKKRKSNSNSSDYTDSRLSQDELKKSFTTDSSMKQKSFAKKEKAEEIPKKKKHKNDSSSIKDMKNMLIQETLNNLNNKIKQESSSEIEDGKRQSPKKKRKNISNIKEDTETKLLLEKSNSLASIDNIKQEIFSDSAKEESPKKKKRNSNSKSIQDMENKLVQEKLNNLTTSNKVNEELSSRTENIKKEKKKKRKRNTNSLEDMESELLQNLMGNKKNMKSEKAGGSCTEEDSKLGSTKKKVKIKKEVKDENISFQLNKFTSISGKNNNIDINELTTAMLLETMTNSKKRKAQKNPIESTSTESHGSKNENIPETKKKKKNKMQSKNDELPSSLLWNYANGIVDSDVKAKTKKKSKKNQIDEVDALIAQFLKNKNKSK